MKDNKIMWFDRQGKPLTDFKEIAKMSSDPNYKIVKQEIVNGYLVSTVWLGLNHSFDDSKILIFETMVFSKEQEKNGFHKDYEQLRYSTEREAIAGHQNTVEKYKNL